MRLFLKKLLIWARYNDVCWTHMNINCWECNLDEKERRFVEFRARRLREIKQELQRQQDAR